MPNPLMARIDKLETKLPVIRSPRRVLTMVAAEHDRKAAITLAREHGFDPDDESSDYLLILRSIVTPEGQTPYTKAPYLPKR